MTATIPSGAPAARPVTASAFPPLSAGWASAAVPIDFAIIGAQKSASTFVQHCLGSHPHVFMPQAESPQFEDPCYGRDSMAELAAELGDAPPGSLRGIKRPDYLARPEVASRLAAHAPAARLIAVLREPVARAVSAYRHYVAGSQIELVNIDVAFAGLLAGTTSDRYPRAPEILTWGRYGQHLMRYRQHFAEDQVLLLLQDEVASEPARAFATACAFLGVATDFTPPDLHERRNVGPQSPLHLRFRRARTRVRRTYLADVARRPFVGRATWPYMATMTAVDRFVMPRIPGALERPSPATVAALREYYREDVFEVQDLVGRELTGWT